MKSTDKRYGTVAIAIHWITALLIVILLGSGFRIGMLDDSAAKATLLRVHVPLGILILLLTLFRIIWWFFLDRKPAPVEGSPTRQEKSAKAVHFLFYIVILAMVGSGIAMMAMSGAGTIVMGGSEAQLPDFKEYAPRFPHGVGARLMIALMLLHIGAALYHHFVQRDGLISRMWFGRDQ
ncbi:cytochrome b [Halovulum sp. GXIMD14793]